MRVPKLLVGLALAVAIAGTSALSAMSVSSAFAAAGNGGPSSGNDVPQYYQPFTNPLIPQYPQQPVFGP